MDADTVECVYSSEEQVTEMLPLSKEQKKNPKEFGVVDNFRCASGFVLRCGCQTGHAGCLFVLSVLFLHIKKKKNVCISICYIWVYESRLR